MAKSSDDGLIYSIGVKVYPDTRGFSDEVEDLLDRVRHRHILEPLVVLSERQKKVFETRYRQFIANLNENHDHVLRPHIKLDYPLRDLERLRERVEALDPKITANLVKERGFDEQLKLLGKTILGHDNHLTIPIGVDHEEAQRRVQEIEHELKDLAGQYEATLNVDLDKGLAEVKLKALTRPRDVMIRPKIDHKYLAVAEATLTRLTGARFAKDLATDFWDFFKNIDKHAPKIGALTVGVGALAAGIGQLSAGTVTLGASLAKFGSFSLLAPGFLASTAIGVSTMVVAFKDADKYVGNLGERFSGLRTTIGSNFWKDIVTPLHEVADDLLPKFNEHLGESSRLLGQHFLLMFQQLRDSLNDGVIDKLFGNLNKSISALAPGVQHATRAFVGLGVQGSEHLITLNTWLSRVFDRFANWVERSGEDGNFDKWIKDATETAKQFGRSLRETGGFLRGLNTAAKRAGSDGLATFERTMRRLNGAVNSSRGQSFLTGFFQASRTAWDTAFRGLDRFMSGVVEARNVLYSGVTSAGETLGNVLAGLGEVVRNNVFQKGLSSLFDGIASASKVLSDHAGSFARVFGSVGSIVGSMLPVLAEWAGLLADVVAPWLEKAAEFAKQFAEGLRWVAQSSFVGFIKGLAGGLSPLAPLLTTVALGVGAWVKALKLMDWARKTTELLGFAGALRKTAEAQAVANAGGIAGGSGVASKAGGLLSKAGLLFGKVALGAGLTLGVAKGVKSLTEWARGIDATAVSYDKLKSSMENASRSSARMDDVVRSWGKAGVFSRTTGEIKNFKQALQTLNEENTHISHFLQNPFWTGLDLTANNVSVLKENIKNFDGVLAGMAQDNLPQFQDALKSALGEFNGVELDKYLQDMPEVKKQLDGIAQQWGITADAANRYGIATGELTTMMNQWGQEILVRLSPAQRDLNREIADSNRNLGTLVNGTPALMTALDNIATKAGLSLSPIEKLGLATGETRIKFDEFGNAVIEKTTNATMTVEQKHAAMREAQKKTLEQFPELNKAWADLARSMGLVPSQIEKLQTGQLDVFFNGGATGKVTATRDAFNDFFAQVTDGKTGYVAAIDSMEGALGDFTSKSEINTALMNGHLDRIKQEAKRAATGYQRSMDDISGATGQMGQDVKLRAELMSTDFNASLAKIREATGETASTVKSSFNMDLSGSGSSVGRSFANGLRSSELAVRQAAESVAALARSFFPNSPAKRGPFSGRGWVTYSGESVGRAWADGLAKNADLPVREAERIADRTKRAVEAHTFGFNARVNHSHRTTASGGALVLKVGDREFTAYVDERATNVVAGASRGRVREMSGI